MCLQDKPDDPHLTKELEALLRYGRRFSSQFNAAIRHAGAGEI